MDYAAQGFLKDPLKNFIALIGWSPGDDREVLSEQDLIETFDLRGLQPSPGKFDFEKLKWLNGMAIRAMDVEALVDSLSDYVNTPYTFEYLESVEPEPNQPDPKVVAKQLRLLAKTIDTNRELAVEAIKLEQPRVQTLADFGPECEFFFAELPDMDQKAVDKWFGQPTTKELFEYLMEQCDQTFGPDSEPAVYDQALRDFQTSRGLEKLGPVVHPTRVALTGKTNGPGLFELMAVLGPERIRRRVERAMGMIG